MSYEAFLAAKAAVPASCGLSAIPSLSSSLKSFQRDIVTWALGRGRAAIFAGTGLGKTVQQLTWADAIVQDTRKPVLALAPLAVAHQTVEEAKKFNIDGVAYAADQQQSHARIVVTNYDRIEKFDPEQFAGIVLDESSIIKAHDSKTRKRLLEFTETIHYRLPCTATPAPNDYVELGNHAEFLGVCSAKEMLATWFVHDGSMKATNVKNHGSKPVAEWRLKGHAESEFWEWLSTWSVMLRHPRELGYDEPGYDLPPLYKHQITVPSDLPIANTLMERRRAARASVEDRCKWAAEFINARPDDEPWSLWCNLNDEADMLASMVKNTVEVRGADKPEQKTDRLLGFASGKYPRLITKPSIAGFGLNFQRCPNFICVGLNDSWEQLFQLVRRHWRFGQTQPVNGYFVASAAEGNVVANLDEKEAAAEYMAREMSKHTATLMTRKLRGQRAPIEFTNKMQLPSWI